MVAPMVVLGAAIATTATACLVPWLQREEVQGIPWERKTAFAILLADSAYLWWAFAHLGTESRDPTWLATLMLLVAAGVIFALFLAARGFTLPDLVRWTLVAVLGLVEPILLTAGFLAVHGPVPLA